MRVALVHDWLTGMRGGEKCLEVLCELFPDAPVYTLLHLRGTVSTTIETHPIRTSFVQHLPLVASRYRSYLPLFPVAIGSFDFSSFDVIISTSHCVAKGARPRPDGLHICYCHTPMRYVWEMYDEYFGKDRADLVTRSAMRLVGPFLRTWDIVASDRVHYFIANSKNVQNRIQRIYHRESEVIPPPVDVRRFVPSKKTGDYYLIVSALVPYKRVDLAVELFNRTGRRLVIVGKGPDAEKLHAQAKSNIAFLGWKSDDELAVLYSECTALIFPGEEDFGIVPLEAMACGKPVIAFRKGGALETMVENTTGVFFDHQDIDSLSSAIERCAQMPFSPEKIRDHAGQFSRDRYKEAMKKSIDEKISHHFL
jgi:glycosyltransferase involved in cell wall biosynthesis